MGRLPLGLVACAACAAASGPQTMRAGGLRLALAVVAAANTDVRPSSLGGSGKASVRLKRKAKGWLRELKALASSDFEAARGQRRGTVAGAAAKRSTSWGGGEAFARVDRSRRREGREARRRVEREDVLKASGREARRRVKS